MAFARGNSSGLVHTWSQNLQEQTEITPESRGSPGNCILLSSRSCIRRRTWRWIEEMRLLVDELEENEVCGSADSVVLVAVVDHALTPTQAIVLTAPMVHHKIFPGRVQACMWR